MGSSGDGRIPPLAPPIDRRVRFVVGRSDVPGILRLSL